MKMENSKLSNREIEVLSLIVDEYTIKEIASQLYISMHTVVSHRKNIQEKLMAKNTAGIVRRAFELRYLDVQYQQAV